jgi:hypothetical protein
MIEYESSVLVKQLHKSADTMSDRPEQIEEDDIPETDFSGAVRGKYYERAMRGTNLVLLEPDVAKVFHDSAVVSQALREYLAEHGAPPALPKTGG